MDHPYKLGATPAKVDVIWNKYYKVAVPMVIYIPRIRKYGQKDKRGWYIVDSGYQGTASRGDWSESQLGNWIWKRNSKKVF